ncbi:Glucitol operon activator [Coriobacterium glomerans PW2]|uniref:Glucitol operon activator n=1 Tax=Coriobacterium glomerans (strain ATCC 49209 / DSM 20642 / JCM 10262 / PW2) TaxID=700015 RepID=F2NAV4_CORGP|nr:transcriptional regulator GutM [Coriobacterium glomerans]AEB07632.1 Glucitol operon activator [Coriobacterium glomerans PW2]
MPFLQIGLMIAAAFLVQALMGFFQIKNFAKHYREVRRRGRVLIGKNPRRFRSGSLMLIGLDSAGRVQEIRVMKGVSVFSRFRELSLGVGRPIEEIGADHDALQRLSRTERECLLNAYRNFINFKTHNLSVEDFDTSSVSIFSLPVFNSLLATGRSKVRKLMRECDRDAI